MNTELSYNAQYDLYVDDYEELAKYGQLADLLPSADYQHYTTFSNVVTDKEYFITSTAWSTSFCGVVAVAYGQNVLCKVDELTSDSDDENYKSKTSRPEEYIPKFNRDTLKNEVKAAALWKTRAGKIKELGDEEEDLNVHNIAAQSLNFIARAQKLRDQELLLDREFELNIPELEDFLFEEEFDYEIYSEDEYDPDENLLAKFELLPTISISEELDPVSLPQKFEDRLKQHSPKDNVPMSQETKSLNLLWDVQNWIFGETLLETALIVHRRHFHEAVQKIGKLIDPPKLRTFVPFFKGKFTGKKKEVRTRGDRLKATRGKTKSPFTQSPRKATKKKDVLAEVADDDYEEEQRIKKIVETEPVHFILIWSLNNVTTPLIRCDSPYEITSLNFCPHNGDLLIGGTISGQVVLWDLQGKLLKKKENLPDNPLDRQAHKILKETMAWYRDLKAPRRVKFTAISSMEDAHTSKVVHIQWIHPYLEFINGRYYGIVDDNVLSAQFLSTSLDGEIKCWDMKTEPLPKPTYYISQKSVVRKNRFPLPEQLYAKRSNYSQLNNRWISIYTIAPPYKKTDNKQTRGSLLAACIQFSSKLYKYERSIPKNPKFVDRLTDTVPYKFSTTKNKEGIASSKNACVGMMTGNVCLMKWTGQERMIEPEAREIPEFSQVEIFETVHDGPITGIVRHPFIKNIALTVGGHVWAIWNLAATSKWPIKWKRYYGVLVTCCSFSPLRPSLFRIGRSDGSVEIWDLMLMSHEPKIVIPAAGSMVTGLSSHNIPLPKGLLGICDYKASLIFYNIPWAYQLWTKSELETLTEMMTDEPKRKANLKEWGEQWRKTHPIRRRSLFRRASSKGVTLSKLVEETGLLKSLTPGRSVLVTAGHNLMQSDLSEEQCKQYFREIYKWYLRRRGNTSRLLTDKDREWYEREEACMIKNLLLNNKIDIKQLQHEMLPLIQDEKKRKEKEMRIKEILAQADEIFKDSVAMILGSSLDTQNKSSVISLKDDEEKRKTTVEAIRNTELVFGELSPELEKELADRVENTIIERPSLDDLLVQGESKRELLNDRRLQQDGPTKKESLGGHEEEYVDWMSHEEIYKIKKFTERVENVDEFKKQHGESYDPLWDFDNKAYTADQVPFKLPFVEEKPERKESTVEEKQFKNLFSALDLDLIADTEQNPAELLLAQEKRGLDSSSRVLLKEIPLQKSSSKLLSEASPDSVSAGSGRFQHSIVPASELSLLDSVTQIAEAMILKPELPAAESDDMRQDSVSLIIDLTQFVPPPKKDLLSKASAESDDEGDLDSGDGEGDEEEQEEEEEEEEKDRTGQDYDELHSKSIEEFIHTVKSESNLADVDTAKETLPEASPPHKLKVTENEGDTSEVTKMQPDQQKVEEVTGESEGKSEGKPDEKADDETGEDETQEQEEIAETPQADREPSQKSTDTESSSTILKPSEYFEERGEEEVISESMLLGEEILEGESIASPGPSPSSSSADISDFIATDESEQEMFDEFFGEAPPSRYVPPIIRKPSTLSTEEPTEEYVGEAEAEQAEEETEEGGVTGDGHRKKMSIPEGQLVGTSPSSSSSDDETGSIDRTFSQLLKDRASIEAERQRQLKEMDKRAKMSKDGDK